jgi:hypothetical protein
MIDVFAVLLKIALLWMPRVIKSREDQDYVKKLIEAALAHYQQSTLDPVSVRRASANLDEELEKKWRERFGSAGEGSRPGA